MKAAVPRWLWRRAHWRAALPGPTSVQSAVPSPSDTHVILRFYASRISDGADVRVQIAGEEVLVLYVGKAGYYPGLDDVHVLVPHSLAGRGHADVVLAVNGRQSKPVHLQLQ